MSQSIQTQAELLTSFADGQVIGSITPEDVRNLVVSVGYLAAFNQFAPLYANGSQSSAVTVNQGNGSVQSVVMTGSTLGVTVTEMGLGAGTRTLVELYVTNNSIGNGQITWPENVTWFGTPQPLAAAGSITRFVLVSLDGGNNWSILP